jgi:uncharacterized protein
VLAAFANDTHWHVPGRAPISGDYHGPAEVLGFFEHFLGLADEGSFSVRIDDVLAKGDRVIVLCTESATRTATAGLHPGPRLDGPGREGERVVAVSGRPADRR